MLLIVFVLCFIGLFCTSFGTSFDQTKIIQTSNKKTTLPIIKHVPIEEKGLIISGESLVGILRKNDDEVDLPKVKEKKRISFADMRDETTYGKKSGKLLNRKLLPT